MEWSSIAGIGTAVVAAVGAVAGFGRKAWKAAAKARKVAVEFIELGYAIQRLCDYVEKASKNGFTEDEGAEAGRLAVRVRKEYKDLVDMVKGGA